MIGMWEKSKDINKCFTFYLVLDLKAEFIVGVFGNIHFYELILQYTAYWTEIYNILMCQIYFCESMKKLVNSKGKYVLVEIREYAKMESLLQVSCILCRVCVDGGEGLLIPCLYKECIRVKELRVSLYVCGCVVTVQTNELEFLRNICVDKFVYDWI